MKNTGQRLNLEKYYKKLSLTWIIIFSVSFLILIGPIILLIYLHFDRYNLGPEFVFLDYIALLFIGFLVSAVTLSVKYRLLKSKIANLYRLITQTADLEFLLETVAVRIGSDTNHVFRILNNMILHGDLSGDLDEKRFHLKPYSDWKINLFDINKLKGMVKIHGQIDLNFAAGVLQMPKQVLLGKIYEIVGAGTACVSIEDDVIKPSNESDTGAILDALDSIFAQWGDKSSQSALKV